MSDQIKYNHTLCNPFFGNPIPISKCLYSIHNLFLFFDYFVFLDIFSNMFQQFSYVVWSYSTSKCILTSCYWHDFVFLRLNNNFDIFNFYHIQRLQGPMLLYTLHLVQWLWRQGDIDARKKINYLQIFYNQDQFLRRSYIEKTTYMALIWKGKINVWSRMPIFSYPHV
jgi:hypothetical protein